jgi:hypothetical protein
VDCHHLDGVCGDTSAVEKDAEKNASINDIVIYARARNGKDDFHTKIGFSLNFNRLNKAVRLLLQEVQLFIFMYHQVVRLVCVKAL